MTGLVIKGIDRNANPPDFVSRKDTRYGTCAWKQNMKAALALQGTKPHAGLMGWVVFAPWAHAFWHYYFIYLVHLRPLPGVPEPKLLAEGMTHEIGVLAMDPHKVPDLVNPLAQRLSPANFVGQFKASTDIDAIAKAERCVKDILDLELSPDTDARWQWQQRFPVNKHGDQRLNRR